MSAVDEYLARAKPSATPTSAVDAFLSRSPVPVATAKPKSAVDAFIASSKGAGDGAQHGLNHGARMLVDAARNTGGALDAVFGAPQRFVSGAIGGEHQGVGRAGDAIYAAFHPSEQEEFTKRGEARFGIHHVTADNRFRDKAANFGMDLGYETITDPLTYAGPGLIKAGWRALRGIPKVAETSARAAEALHDNPVTGGILKNVVTNYDSKHFASGKGQAYLNGIETSLRNRYGGLKHNAVETFTKHKAEIDRVGEELKPIHQEQFMLAERKKGVPAGEAGREERADIKKQEAALEKQSHAIIDTLPADVRTELHRVGYLGGAPKARAGLKAQGFAAAEHETASPALNIVPDVREYYLPDSMLPGARNEAVLGRKEVIRTGTPGYAKHKTVGGSDDPLYDRLVKRVNAGYSDIERAHIQHDILKHFGLAAQPDIQATLERIAREADPKKKARLEALLEKQRAAVDEANARYAEMTKRDDDLALVDHKTAVSDNTLFRRGLGKAMDELTPSQQAILRNSSQQSGGPLTARSRAQDTGKLQGMLAGNRSGAMIAQDFAKRLSSERKEVAGLADAQQAQLAQAYADPLGKARAAKTAIENHDAIVEGLKSKNASVRGAAADFRKELKDVRAAIAATRFKSDLGTKADKIIADAVSKRYEAAQSMSSKSTMFTKADAAALRTALKKAGITVSDDEANVLFGTAYNHMDEANAALYKLIGEASPEARLGVPAKVAAKGSVDEYKAWIASAQESLKKGTRELTKAGVVPPAVRRNVGTAATAAEKFGEKLERRKLLKPVDIASARAMRREGMAPKVAPPAVAPRNEVAEMQHILEGVPLADRESVFREVFSGSADGAPEHLKPYVQQILEMRNARPVAPPSVSREQRRLGALSATRADMEKKLAERNLRNSVLSRAQELKGEAADRARKIQVPQFIADRAFPTTVKSGGSALFAPLHKAAEMGKDALFLNPIPHMKNILTLQLEGPGGERVAARGVQITAGGMPKSEFDAAAERLDRIGARSSFFKERSAAFDAVPVLGKATAGIRQKSHDALWHSDTAQRIALLEHIDKHPEFKGLSEFEKGQIINDTLFDYAHQSPLSEGLRNVGAPFANWRTGNIARQAHAVVENPRQVERIVRAERLINDDGVPDHRYSMEFNTPADEGAKAVLDPFNKWKYALTTLGALGAPLKAPQDALQTTSRGIPSVLGDVARTYVPGVEPAAQAYQLITGNEASKYPSKAPARVRSLLYPLGAYARNPESEFAKLVKDFEEQGYEPFAAQRAAEKQMRLTHRPLR